MKYEYHLECPFLDRWNRFLTGSRDYCRGYLEALRGQAPRLPIRMVRSDGKVLDEITLAWLSRDPKSQIWFDGRHSKMVSQLGALATLYFKQHQHGRAFGLQRQGTAREKQFG